MDLDLTAEELSFRDEVRSWLGDNVPPEPRPRDGVEAREYDLAWQARQYEGGWAGIADRLGRAQAEVTALRAMTWAGASRTERTRSPGSEGSMIRVMYAELSQRVHALAMDILGPAGLDAERPDGWTHRWLYEFAATIGGGTSQIQREIIAERVLGLPRSR